MDTTAVSNLAIISTPVSGNSNQDILVRDNSTGIIKTLPKSEATIDHVTASTLTLDFSNNDYFNINLAADFTGLTLTNLPLRREVYADFFQSGTTGNYDFPTTNMPTEIKTVDGVNPDWSYTSGTTTLWVFNRLTVSKTILTSLGNIS